MHFFPHEASSCTDRLFKFMPNDVRGPILAVWGIRGAKAALRDNDEKVQSVVHDALVAGDIDHGVFEEGLSSETVVRWVPLAEWWTFWRGGKLSKLAIQKALATAYELLLFDAKWFLDTIESRGGKLRGTDVLADGLTKDDLTEWMRRVHESGDGSPKGLLTAIGWDKVVAKTANEVLIAVLDAMVGKVALVKPATPSADGKGGDKPGSPGASPTIPPGAIGVVASAASAPTPMPMPMPAASGMVAKTEASKKTGTEKDSDIEWNDPEPVTAGGEVENEPTISQKGDLSARATAAAEDSASDDAMIVVVDDDVDMASMSSPPVRGENDPPTARKLEVAKAVSPDDTDQKDALKAGSNVNKRTGPPPPPPKTGRERSAR